MKQGEINMNYLRPALKSKYKLALSSALEFVKYYRQK